MTAGQVLLYSLMALVVVFCVRRWWLGRSIPHYTPAELRNLLKGRNAPVLLDVRTEAERKEKQIKGSFHIPLHHINSRREELKRFGDREFVCYCRTGSRSLSAAIKLKRLGFRSANLKGGLIEWRFSGEEV